MLVCLFASDLHGQPSRYRKLFTQIEAERPAAVFLGGDLLPSPFAHWNPEKDQGGDFVPDLLAANFERLRDRLAGSYPGFVARFGVTPSLAGNPEPPGPSRFLATAIG